MGIEIKIPLRSLAREVEEQLPLASASKDLPRGRKWTGWKKEFLRSLAAPANDLQGVPQGQISKAIRDYRSARKKLPEITVIGNPKKKNGLVRLSVVDTSVMVTEFGRLPSEQILR